MTLQSYMHRSLRAVTAVGLLSLIWLVVLPWIGERSVVREHIRMMEQGNIDPSAMYYTELAGLEETEATFRELAEEHPGLLWSLSRVDTAVQSQ